MKTPKHILTAIAILTGCFISAQDIHFSQFTTSPLTLNPGLAGAQNDMCATLNYKNQWQSVASPYKTTAVSFDMRLTRKKGASGVFAAGANFYSDRAGDAKMGITLGSASLAYHLHAGDNASIGAGIQVGFAQRSINYSALEWGNQYDGNVYNAALSSNEPSSAPPTYNYMDLGAGLVYNYNNRSGSRSVTDNHYKQFTFGISTYHLNKPVYSYYGTADTKLSMKTVVHGSALISVANSNVAFAPAFMYMRQGSAQELILGSLIRYTVKQDSKYTGFKDGAAISMGAYLRAKDAVAAIVLFEYSNYSIGISYDMNISQLKTVSSSRGGLEVSLKFVTPNPFRPSTSRRMLD
jgi:type IX secretion system PorP/SprF family membrane protein